MKHFIKCLIPLILAVMLFGPSPSQGEPAEKKSAKKKQAAANSVITLSTTLGNITIELNSEKAPITVKNFLSYVDAGFYDGTIFHRVIPNFMIQGGGFTKDMKQKQTRPPIKNEADNGLRNSHGTVSMARTSDVNSVTSQFFINLKDNTFLDHMVRDFGYAVFGKVVKGMDVVDKIAAVQTGNRGMQQNVPIKEVVIKSARRK